MHNPPTMQDVANAAGVGKATVSLALRNDPRLRPETRERIQKIAVELGYRANATVANLMAQLRASRTPKYQASLALLNGSKDPSWFRTVTTFRYWIAGARERATQLGYSIDDFWLHEPGMTGSRLARVLDSRNIRGVIVAGVLNHGELPVEYQEIWERFACVAIGIRATIPPINSASNDQFSTARSAMEQLKNLGYTRPGLVLNPTIDRAVDYRFSAGYWSGQQDFPEKDRLPVFAFEENREADFKQWVEKHKPDVLICLHDVVREWVKKCGLAIPGQIGLIHLDRTEVHPDWAGMNQNSPYVGAAAIDMLIGQLHRNEMGVPSFAKSAMVQGNWVPGDTVKQQKKKK